MKRNMRTKKAVPAFHSLREESDFWDRESPLEYGDWREVSSEEIMAGLKRESRRKRQVSLRLEPDLIADLKSLAKRYGVPYQKLARELLRKGVGSLSS